MNFGAPKRTRPYQKILIQYKNLAILATAYKVWNLSKMFYLVNINLESTSKISLERNLKLV